MPDTATTTPARPLVVPHFSWTMLGQGRGTIFVRLPRELWRSCGSCDCPRCRGGEGFWDTLAVPTDGRGHTYTVHHPEARHGNK